MDDSDEWMVRLNGAGRGELEGRYGWKCISIMYHGGALFFLLGV